MEKKNNVILLDFWAAWCGPCKIMNPIIEELEKTYEGKIGVAKYDVDDAKNQEFVQKYGVMAMPTYIIEKDGEVVEQFVGAQPKSALVNAIDKALA
jgi:thioredoxin 1